MKKQLITLSVLSLGFLLGASALSALAAGSWSAPTAPPPGGNVAAPINVGVAGGPGQSKLDLLGLSNFLFNPTGVNNITPGYVLTALDANGNVGWKPASATGNYTVVPTWSAKTVCPTDGTFYSTGDGTGPSGDMQYKCSGGYVIAISDGTHTPANAIDTLPRCSNTSWTFFDQGDAHDLTITCDASGGYVRSICNTSYACPSNAAIIYAAGTGVYCNWSGAIGEGNGDDFDCEGNHLFSVWVPGQTQPAYVQNYSLTVVN